MSGSSRHGNDPDQGPTGSWAAESLPMAVRKELLERELRKMGYRGSEGRSSQQQQQPQGGNSHPQADSDTHGEHGD
ncbi:MAG: hypothetical protein JWP22_1902 [Ramlibacter sp.]|jgi:hypothetical protein|nr:hypothetical protein [Ramlibacter sp.]MDB5913227.1 hypothetical protein [Ramlibacter sp.]